MQARSPDSLGGPAFPSGQARKGVEAVQQLLRPETKGMGLAPTL